MAILREHLLESRPVSDVCGQPQSQPTLFCQWQRTFFENGAAAFVPKRPTSQALSKEQQKITALEAKLRTRTEVIAEVVEELVRTKKELGESCRAAGRLTTRATWSLTASTAWPPAPRSLPGGSAAGWNSPLRRTTIGGFASARPTNTD